jgi:hypothetical protein
MSSKRLKAVWLGLAVLLALSGKLLASQEDVTFVVIGKHANYLQNSNGIREVEDYSFFSEIFLTAAGDASAATLRLPTGEQIAYEDMRAAQGGARDNIFLVKGVERYSTLAQLQRRYPDGEYQVSFVTPSGSVDERVLRFNNRGLPKAPRIWLSQGARGDCQRVAAGVDLIVSWDKFGQGRADENKILDDLIFVILTDAEGNRVAHSGRPFEGQPFLTYGNVQFAIDGEVLQPGQSYTLSVEHAMLDDTTRFAGVPAFTTRAVTTKLQLVTLPKDATACEPNA